MNKEKLEAYKNGLNTRYTGMTDKLKDEIEGIEVKEIDLDSMSKDELNDYAVSIGLTDEVSMNMKKQDMIDIIKKYKEGDK